MPRWVRRGAYSPGQGRHTWYTSHRPHASSGVAGGGWRGIPNGAGRARCPRTQCDAIPGKGAGCLKASLPPLLLCDDGRVHDDTGRRGPLLKLQQQQVVQQWVPRSRVPTCPAQGRQWYRGQCAHVRVGGSEERRREEGVGAGGRAGWETPWTPPAPPPTGWKGSPKSLRGPRPGPGHGHRVLHPHARSPAHPSPAQTMSSIMAMPVKADIFFFTMGALNSSSGHSFRCR